ncbi:MAG: ion transporter [Micrococcales bacterium]|nr:ion transporter [Micrococcales bacterium]MCL2668670.1 ion transporter [Micrococcales bacterium]
MRLRVKHLVDNPWFDRAILTVIVINAVVLGVETVPAVMDHHEGTLTTANHVFIGIYVVEMVLKLIAFRGSYFRSGWNLFDFVIVMTSLAPTGGVFSGLRILRILRVLRILRLVSGLKPLRKIVSSISRSLPGISWTVLLMMIVYYVFAIVGIHLFRAENPERFDSIPTAFVTLFQLTTLDNWESVVFPLTEAHSWAWAYFLLFIVVTSFVLINVILGIVVDSLNLQTKEDEIETCEAAAEDDACAADRLRCEVLTLKAQVDRIAALVEQTVEPPEPAQ